jgi:hypothetical protein
MDGIWLIDEEDPLRTATPSGSVPGPTRTLARGGAAIRA